MWSIVKKAQHLFQLSKSARLCIMYAAVSIFMYISWQCLCVCVGVCLYRSALCPTVRPRKALQCAMPVPPAPTTPSFFFIITPSWLLCNCGKNNTMLVLSAVACNTELLLNILFFCGQLYVSFSFRRKTTVSSFIGPLSLSFPRFPYICGIACKRRSFDVFFVYLFVYLSICLFVSLIIGGQKNVWEEDMS